jgi:hypothetical protein
VDKYRFFATPLDTGTGDPNVSNKSVNLGGLDISYLPRIAVCKLDPTAGLSTSNWKMTTDLGQALIDGKFDHVSKTRDPSCAGYRRATPHNGSARSSMVLVMEGQDLLGAVPLRTQSPTAKLF